MMMPAADLAGAPRGRIRALVRGCAPFALERFFELGLEGERTLWDESTSGPLRSGWAAVGTSVVRRGAVDTCHALARRLAFDVEPESSPLVRLFACGPFACGPSAGGPPRGRPWEGVPDFAVALPRWFGAVLGDGSACVGVLASATEHRSHGAALRAMVDRLALALDGPHRTTDRPWPPSSFRVKDDGRDPFRARVQKALAAIDAGRVTKVVPARQVHVGLGETPSLPAVLRNLTAASGAHRYCFEGPWGTFVGATPERLVEVGDGHVEAEALAGSATSAADLDSDKNRREHDVVAATVSAGLSALSVSLESTTTCRLHLPDLVHARTVFRGRRPEGLTALAAAHALHPTPAVGGAPAQDARTWLAEHDIERGLFAGPIGVMDPLGRGTFRIALRGGLLRGSDAWLYAGTGIVAGSNVEAELEETEWKLRTMTRALGGAS